MLVKEVKTWNSGILLLVFTSSLIPLIPLCHSERAGSGGTSSWLAVKLTRMVNYRAFSWPQAATILSLAEASGINRGGGRILRAAVLQALCPIEMGLSPPLLHLRGGYSPPIPTPLISQHLQETLPMDAGLAGISSSKFLCVCAVRLSVWAHCGTTWAFELSRFSIFLHRGGPI